MRWIAVLLVFAVGLSAAQCELTMGYKKKKKEPYIEEENAGLYVDLFTKAAEKIGCDLKIERTTKQRVINGLEKGTIDFYPGFTFTEERSQFIYYIPNGLTEGLVAITRAEEDDIASPEQITERKLKVLRELGGAKVLEDKGHKVDALDVSELNLEKAVKMIKGKRADVYIYNSDQIRYYVKTHKTEEIKVHEEAVDMFEDMMLGFSKQSPNIKLVKNEKYDPKKPLSPKNYPEKLDESCVAYKLAQALKVLKDSGETQKLYDQYFK